MAQHAHSGSTISRFGTGRTRLGSSQAFGKKGSVFRIRRHRETHAALVFDGSGAAQGWCQYGNPEELPGIKHRREYAKDAPPRPDWRITCFYVDKKHRGEGIARAAHSSSI